MVLLDGYCGVVMWLLRCCKMVTVVLLGGYCGVVRWLLRCC